MRTERMNLRLDPATDALLREAAALAGKSLTAFLLDAARAEARRVVDDHHRLVLTRETVARLAEPQGEPVAAPVMAPVVAPAPVVTDPPPAVPPRRTHVDV